MIRSHVVNALTRLRHPLPPAVEGLRTNGRWRFPAASPGLQPSSETTRVALLPPAGEGGRRPDEGRGHVTTLGLALAFILLLAPTLIAQPATPGSRVPDAAQFVGAPKGAPATGEALMRETDRISALLRCPVCQGLSVADSRATQAVNMRDEVHALLARGYSEEQILQYFERSYGQFVLLKPKFEGLNTLVWLLPVVALAIGVGIVMFKMRRLEQPLAQPAPVNPDDEYMDRVRELVGGGKE